jgi:hypothetical protein
VSEEKSPIEKAVELAIYAPVGFVKFMQTMLPGWIENGRQEVTKQVTNAKAMSEFAIAQGRQDAEKGVAQVAQVVSSLNARRQPAPPAPPPPSATAPPTPTTASTPSTPASPSTNGPRPNADNLAIPGYDSLAASQVVQRLGGLSSAELDAVRDYEEATRGRRTILNKVGQLQAETSP